MINLETIYKLSSYTDADGTARSATALIRGKAKEGEEPVDAGTIYLEAPVALHGTGGCTVAVFSFPKTDRAVFLRTSKACMDWLNEEDPEESLILSIVPMYFAGKLNILLHHLTFCDFYETSRVFRLILAFDGTKTQIYADENVDIEKLQKEAELEAEMELKRVGDAIAAEEEEQAAIEEQITENLMGDLNGLGDILSPEEEGEGEEDEALDPNSRYSSEEDEEIGG